jgi:hypothetical protein
MVGVGELVVVLVAVGAGLIVSIAFVVIVVVLVLGTARRSRMGINLSADNACPRCGAPVPMVRTPKNLRQALWGGWTCAACGCEMDKWARPLDGG